MKAACGHRATRRLAAATLVVLTVVSVAPPVALAAPSLTVTPAAAIPGSAMIATGAGFAPGEPVAMYLDGEEFDRLTVALAGTFVAAFTLPLNISSGRHTVTAVASTGEASASFTAVIGSTTTTPAPTTTSPAPATSTPPTTSPPIPTTPTTTSPTTTVPLPITAPTSPPRTPNPEPPVPTTTLPDPTVTPPTTTRPGESQDTPTPTSPDSTSPGQAADDPTTSITSLSIEASTTVISIPGDSSGGILPGRTPVAAGQPLPRITGASVAIGTFSVSPAKGPMGARITMDLGLAGAIPGLTVVEFRLAGHQLGEEVGIDTDQITVHRTVPALEPGIYSLTVESGNLVLASTDFEVASTQMTGPTTRLWLVPLVILITLLSWSLVGALRSTGDSPSIGRPTIASRLRHAIILRK